MNSTYEVVTRAQIEAYEREKEGQIRQGQQLYAKVKRNSHYYHQNDWAKAEPERWGGFPFKVLIDPSYGDYCVQGGPGGQYRLRDVNIYVVVDGRELRIS